jgi:EAL domain-containing protein (putative c-di-GMP-specific phosphodiesterase class I)
VAKVESGRVLLVETNHATLKAGERALAAEGWTVETARDGLEARQCLEKNSFEAIVSDINLPGYGGLELLRAVRERDLDVPVILMTSKPSVESSIRAIEYGVFRYLIKPVSNQALVEVVGRASRLHKMAQLKREALTLAGLLDTSPDDREALGARFARATELLWTAFQPIVSWQDRKVFGYEALLRSDEPTFANPGKFLEAAEQLGKVHELGRSVRTKVADAASQVPVETALFVNLHSADLNDEHLRDPYSALSRVAHRVVLEVTERASLDSVRDAPLKVKALKGMGFRIAVDDLGTGYAGLTSFTSLEPDIVKIDMSLIRGIDAQPKKQSIVRSMKNLCDDLGMLVVAEGVETPAERDTLLGLGYNLLQGYLFARPERGFPVPRW